jgi:hypothetical protein
VSRGPQAALPGDQLEAAARQRPHHDRLEHPARPDRLGELGEPGVVEGLSRLPAVRLDQLERDVAKPFLDLAAARQDGVEAAAHGAPLLSHARPPLAMRPQPRAATSFASRR